MPADQPHGACVVHYTAKTSRCKPFLLIFRKICKKPHSAPENHHFCAPCLSRLQRGGDRLIRKSAEKCFYQSSPAAGHPFPSVMRKKLFSKLVPSVMRKKLFSKLAGGGAPLSERDAKEAFFKARLRRKYLLRQAFLRRGRSPVPCRPFCFSCAQTRAPRPAPR